MVTVLALDAGAVTEVSLINQPTTMLAGR
jgi:hypothetical protein